EDVADDRLDMPQGTVPDGSEWLPFALRTLTGEGTWLEVAKAVVDHADLHFIDGIQFGAAGYRRNFTS
ncbi:MAG TPA: hypothetical protein VHS28_07710, partial [Chloroflexota bacterium]|nr:hypothetical protein [Chloroflexota bacterium]